MMSARRNLFVAGTCTAQTTGSIVEVRGSGRARRMVRRRSLATSGDPPWGSVIPGTAVWTDYDGDVVYGDYVANFDANNQFTGLTDTKSYLPGIGEAASSPGLVTPSYYHADQIGSLRLATDGTGHVIGRYVYSAFGEMILEDGGAANTAALRTRYKFGGAWQYETGLGADETGNDPLPFIRIGHRWYDPGTGRFLQRDPIGIDGGLNVYAYCENNPVDLVDPSGESWWPNKGRIRYGPSYPRGYPRTQPPRIAFRIGPNIHIWGARGALAMSGCVLIAATTGVAVGLALDAGVAAANNGFGITDGLGDIIFRWFYEEDPHYDPWGHGSS